MRGAALRSRNPQRCCSSPSRSEAESLIGYPLEMTSASVKGIALEVPENVVRLSLGIEGVADLPAELLEVMAWEIGRSILRKFISSS